MLFCRNELVVEVSRKQETSLVDHFTQFNASQIPTKNNTASNAGAQKPGKKTSYP